MMFGTEVSMPIDVMVGRPGDSTQEVCPNEYVEWLKNSLHHSYEYASRQLSANAGRQKRYYDLRAKPIQYERGSYVWRWYWPAARGKFGKGWVGPFKVVATPSPIHCLIQRSPNSVTVRVHIDALKPHFGSIPPAWVDESEEVPVAPPPDLMPTSPVSPRVMSEPEDQSFSPESGALEQPEELVDSEDTSLGPLRLEENSLGRGCRVKKPRQIFSPS
eukprot:GHVN01043835.1.p1 GENE.GHVN01043835.1~~GHVN01043835.1.p1  ORF type:complete len:217 (+),score=4.33 GHVN01043835.1:1-651(+)